MGLSVLHSAEKRELKPETRMMLEIYMIKASHNIGDVFRSDARKKAGEYAKDFYRSFDKAKALTETDVEAMEKWTDKKLKEFGWRQRLNYHLNGKAIEEAGKNGKDVFLRSVRGITALGAGMILAAPVIVDNPQFVAAGVGMMLLKSAVLGGGIVDKDPVKTGQYTFLKHAQLALKQLKREIKKAERSGKDALKEQPNAGLIQAARLKNQGR